MSRFDFYKELYFKENEQKKTLADSLNLPIAIMSSLIAWLYYFYSNITFDVEIHQFWGRVILIIAFVFILRTFYSLILSYFRPDISNKKFRSKFNTLYAYGKIVDLVDYENSYQNLLIKYENDPDFETKSNSEYEEAMIEDILVCVDRNSYLNGVKTSHILSAKKYMIFALSFTLLLLGYTVCIPKVAKSPSEIKIVNPVKIQK